jgi:exosortase/archaeosortase family protein
VQTELRKRHVFVLSLLSSLTTLAVLFYLYETKSLVILSPPLDLSEGYFESILFEYLPLAMAILVLVWLRLESIGGGDEKMSTVKAILVVTVSALATFAAFRVLDLVFMVMYPNQLSTVELTFSYVWIHATYFGLFSMILFVTSTVSFELKGIKSLFTIYIIPAFYALNADLVMTSNKIPALSILYPVYVLILEIGKYEVLALGWLLNALGFTTIIYTNVFPYRLIMGGTMYSVDLPCIGWEGFVIYTIIFLNLIMYIEKENKQRLIWWGLGILGTLAVNLLRLVLIFVAGAIWGVSIAQVIHYNMGDVIFLVWIFGFTYFVYWFKKSGFSLYKRKKNNGAHENAQGKNPNLLPR